MALVDTEIYQNIERKRNAERRVIRRVNQYIDMYGEEDTLVVYRFKKGTTHREIRDYMKQLTLRIKYRLNKAGVEYRYMMVIERNYAYVLSNASETIDEQEMIELSQKKSEMATFLKPVVVYSTDMDMILRTTRRYHQQIVDVVRSGKEQEEKIEALTEIYERMQAQKLHLTFSINIAGTIKG